MSDQKNKPHLNPVEQGRLFTPPYEPTNPGLAAFDVRTAEWKHVCSARFGDGRLAWRSRDGKSETRWTGDSYRYDIFCGQHRERDAWALRWWNGAGEGWLIAEDKKRHEEISLLEMIAQIPKETRRWDACHFLWESIEKSATLAALTEKRRYCEAFLEKRLKRRKRRGMYPQVVIEPKGEGARC